MIEKLISLHTVLGKEAFTLTGSTALAYHGLIDFEDAKDLDIRLFNPSKTTIEVLDRLQSANPNPKFKIGGRVNYSFIYEDVKVDIWIVDIDESCDSYTKDGIRLASIKSIVKAKLEIGRSKDWIHLMQLAKKIYDPIKFEEQLSSINNHSESYD